MPNLKSIGAVALLLITATCLQARDQSHCVEPKQTQRAGQATVREVGRIPGPAGIGLQFSSDSERRICDDDGNRLGHDESMGGAVISPDGLHVFAYSMASSRIYSATTGVPETSERGGSARHACFSSISGLFVCDGTDSVAGIWDIARDQRIVEFPQMRPNTGVAISRNGRFAAVTKMRGRLCASTELAHVRQV
ncbi:MAG TPA: hypothetical protein VFE47_15035 [Tepidisphaeraceae bacterium]|jgi:hypothetical protein|nr:hypothetical protein [Tepidisphaeraceae bacterium]